MIDRLNWIGYYAENGGYGKMASRFVKALKTWGIDVAHITGCDLERPQWMLDEMGVSWDNLTILNNEPRRIEHTPGRRWLFTMCEGEVLSSYVIRKINRGNIDRIVVPCQFCVDVFRKSGIKHPMSIVSLGTDPAEHLPRNTPRPDRPYTFLTIADRGDRKGWTEAFDAFYKAFGGKTTGDRDVALIVKSLGFGNNLAKLILKHSGDDMDKRVSWDISFYPNMADLYSKVDCVVLPSRSEGWGMPHREAAMQGLPVILQKYAGLDDGHTGEWAICVDGGRMQEVPKKGQLGGGGNWLVADSYKVAEAMRWCYENQGAASAFGYSAHHWLAAHQTWMDAAAELINLMHDELGWEHASNLQYTSHANDGVSSSRISLYDLAVGQERGASAS